MLALVLITGHPGNVDLIGGLHEPTAEVRRNARRFQYVSDGFHAPLSRAFLDAIREFESEMRFLVGTGFDGSVHGFLLF